MQGPFKPTKPKAYNLYGIKFTDLQMVGHRYFIRLLKKAVDEGTKYIGIIEKIGEPPEDQKKKLMIGDIVLFVQYEISMGDTYYVVPGEHVIMRLEPEEDLSRSK